MNRLTKKQKIDLALSKGVHRKLGKRAQSEQVLTYILSDRKFFHHATLESAKAEKEFLQFALERNVRIYKVWNSNRGSIEADLKFLRTKLDGLMRWSESHKAIDRLLIGAGY